MVTENHNAESAPGDEQRPIYVAKRLADAQRLEAAFEAAGIEYEVAPETYLAGVIFRSARVGAFFYVAEELRSRAAAVMVENNFIPVK